MRLRNNNNVAVARSILDDQEQTNFSYLCVTCSQYLMDCTTVMSVEAHVDMFSEAELRCFMDQLELVLLPRPG